MAHHTPISGQVAKLVGAREAVGVTLIIAFLASSFTVWLVNPDNSEVALVLFCLAVLAGALL